MHPIEHGALVSYTFLMTLTPGPTTLMVAVSGARFGFTRSVPHVAGTLVGYELQLLAAVAGLTTVSLFLPDGGADLMSGAALLLWAGAAGTAGMCIWATCGTSLRHALGHSLRRAWFNRCMAAALLLTAASALWR